MPFTLPPLPYAYDALEPHDRRADDGDPSRQAPPGVRQQRQQGARRDRVADSPVEKVLANLDALPEDIRTAVRNNGGGHANHTLFWQIMGPDGGGEPEGDLAAAINDVSAARHVQGRRSTTPA